MKNEYGAALEGNGYAPSLLAVGEGCVICGRSGGKVDRHEIFHGAYRAKSKRLGLWCLLCHDCHMRLHQRDAAADLYLKQAGQLAAMEVYGWTTGEFISQFGKNYLEE